MSILLGTLGFLIEVLHFMKFWGKIPGFTFIKDYITVNKKVCRKTLLFSTYTFILPYTSITNPRLQFLGDSQIACRNKDFGFHPIPNFMFLTQVPQNSLSAGTIFSILFEECFVEWPGHHQGVTLSNITYYLRTIIEFSTKLNVGPSNSLILLQEGQLSFLIAYSFLWLCCSGDLPLISFK